jgi:hypothetical protein
VTGAAAAPASSKPIAGHGVDTPTGVLASRKAGIEALAVEGPDGVLVAGVAEGLAGGPPHAQSPRQTVTMMEVANFISASCCRCPTFDMPHTHERQLRHQYTAHRRTGDPAAVLALVKCPGTYS